MIYKYFLKLITISHIKIKLFINYLLYKIFYSKVKWICKNGYNFIVNFYCWTYSYRTYEKSPF